MADSTSLFQHIQSLIVRGHNPHEHQNDIYREYGQTVAVMVIDSVGFSRVARQQGILHFLTQMVRAREIIAPVLEKHSAIDVRFEADNAYAVFSHANDAMRAAEAVHQAIRDARVMLTSDEPYQVCIGIGYGELLHAGEEGYFGDQMNLASKLGEDVANGAETLITIETHAAAEDELTAGFTEDTLSIAGIDLRYARKKQP